MRSPKISPGRGPFGSGNTEPIFAIADASPERIRQVGESHLACELASPSGERVRAIAFRAIGGPIEEMLRAANREGRRLHFAGKIKADEWRGGDAAQFQIVDAALSD